MSDNTPRLSLPELVQMQEMDSAQINEALLQLDALGDVFLQGLFVNTPPGSPADGDTYVTGGAPTGAWSGYNYKLAYCIDGAWRFFNPFDGLVAYLATTSGFVVYRGGQWTALGALLAGPEAVLASAATCDLASAGALTICVTGTTTITSLGSGINQLCLVRFAQALTLTHNATSLILLGAAGRTTAANDVGIYRSDASGNWRELSYTRAAIAPDSLVTLTAAQTLTSKTLTAPTLTTPTLGVAAGTSLALGGAAIGSDALGVSGSATISGQANLGSVNVTSGTLGGYGLSLSGTTLQLVTNGSIRFQLTSSGLSSSNAGGPQIVNGAAASTVPTLVPNRGAATTGIGAPSGGGISQIVGGAEIARVTASALQPGADNSINLGTASLRWGTVYAGTGSINTSDAALKTNLRTLSDAEVAVARALAGQVQVFQFTDAIARKGDGARLHVGQLFQSVCDAFAAQGLDPNRYGLVCQDAVVDDDGAPVLDAAGAPKLICGLRYDELAQFVLAGIAARLAALEAA